MKDVSNSGVGVGGSRGKKTCNGEAVIVCVRRGLITRRLWCSRGGLPTVVGRKRTTVSIIIIRGV